MFRAWVGLFGDQGLGWGVKGLGFRITGSRASRLKM